MTLLGPLFVALAVFLLFYAVATRIRLRAEGNAPAASMPPALSPALAADESSDTLVHAAQRFYGLAGSGISVRRALAVHLAVTGGVAFPAIVLLGWPLAGFVAPPVLGFFAVREYSATLATRNYQELTRSLSDAIASLRDIIRSGGATLEAGFAQLAESGPPLLRNEFTEITRGFAEETFEFSLQRAQERIRHPLFDSLAVACIYAYRAGGRNVSAIMDRLAGAARERVAVRREARARQTEAIWTGRAMGAMPLILLAFNARDAELFGTFKEPIGQIVLTVAFLLAGGGYFWMMRIATLSEEPRVLLPTDSRVRQAE